MSKEKLEEIIYDLDFSSIKSDEELEKSKLLLETILKVYKRKANKSDYLTICEYISMSLSEYFIKGEDSYSKLKVVLELTKLIENIGGNIFNSNMFLNNLVIYLDTLEEYQKRKVLYVLYNNSDLVKKISFSNLYDIREVFPKTVLEVLSKETLRDIYRCSFDAYNDLFSELSEKSIFMLCILLEKDKITYSNNGALIDIITKVHADYYTYDEVSRFDKLLESAYDYYVMDESLEISAINNLYTGEYQLSLSILRKALFERVGLNNYTDINILIDKYLKKKQKHHELLSSIDENVSPELFDEVKTAFLENYFGITVRDAKYFLDNYGLFIEPLRNSIKKEDYKSYEVLFIICKIANLNYHTNDEATCVKYMNMLKKVYFDLYNSDEFDRNTLEVKGIYNSFVSLENMFNKMYFNTYNIHGSNCTKSLIKIDSGVHIIDIGTNFRFMVSSVGAITPYYNEDDDMMRKWNSSKQAINSAICCSYISNSNLGVIDLDYPLLVFEKIDSDSLNCMGPCDIYSSSTGNNLRASNKLSESEYKFFIPDNCIDKCSRYGYNEFLIDRFKINDGNWTNKVQPTALVYYKLDEFYEDMPNYKATLKTAKDFNLPIYIIDVPLVKENEKLAIESEIKLLFENERVDRSLLSDIITRLMNNFSGSYTLRKQRPYSNIYSEFSIHTMRDFFTELCNRVSNIEDVDILREWIDALLAEYKIEKKLNRIAQSSTPFKHSLNGEFVLDDTYSVGEMIRYLNSIYLNLLEKKQKKATL